MAGTGNGQRDEHLDLLRQIKKGQDVATRIAARREADFLIHKAKVEALEREIFGSKQNTGLRKMVTTLTTRMHLAMGALVIIAGVVAWIANHLNLGAVLVGASR